MAAKSRRRNFFMGTWWFSRKNKNDQKVQFLKFDLGVKTDELFLALEKYQAAGHKFIIQDL
jgi:hypothetical protein